MWQSVLAVVHLRASLPMAGFCTNTLSPFVSPYVNVEVSGGDGALVRKLAFSSECASEEMQGAHTLEVCGVISYGYSYACELPP